jgi:hypothetical protein
VCPHLLADSENTRPESAKDKQNSTIRTTFSVASSPAIDFSTANLRSGSPLLTRPSSELLDAPAFVQRLPPTAGSPHLSATFYAWKCERKCERIRLARALCSTGASRPYRGTRDTPEKLHQLESPLWSVERPERKPDRDDFRIRLRIRHVNFSVT